MLSEGEETVKIMPVERKPFLRSKAETCASSASSYNKNMATCRTPRGIAALVHEVRRVGQPVVDDIRVHALTVGEQHLAVKLTHKVVENLRCDEGLGDDGRLRLFAK